MAANSAATAKDPPATKPAAAIATVKQMLAPTNISFKCDNLSRDDTVAALSKTVGFSLFKDDWMLGAGGKVTCDLTDKPMMAVMAAVCEKADIRIDPSSFDSRAPFHLMDYGQSDHVVFPASVDSSILPFVTIRTMTSRENGKELSALEAMVQIAYEPKVYVVASSGLNIDAAVDDKNRSLEPIASKGVPGSLERPWNYMYAGTSVYGAARMKYPAAPATTIKRIKGSLAVQLGFNIQHYDLSAVLEDGKTATFPFSREAPVTLSDFGPDPKQRLVFVATMKMPRIKLPSGRAIEDDPPELLVPRWEASDKENRFWWVTLEPLRPPARDVAQFKVRMRPKFSVTKADAEKKIRPDKITVTIPGRSETTSIPFDFTDIPIPAVKK